MPLSPENSVLWNRHLDSLDEGEALLLRSSEAFGPRYFTALSKLLDAARLEGRAAGLEARPDGFVLAYAGCPGAWRVKPEDLA